MGYLMAVGTSNPKYEVSPETTSAFIRNLFSKHHHDIERLLQVVQNGEIQRRYVSAPVEWFTTSHSLEEKNNLYIQLATELGVEAVDTCLQNAQTIGCKVNYQDIDAIIFVSSSGIATPTIDAKIMNQRSFSAHTKRIPLWGLGCAGGVSGVARAYEYCKAFPKANVLVLCVELCSLTFQRDDYSKSNLIGTSLFADGVACVLVAGEQATSIDRVKKQGTRIAKIIDTMSTLMPDSEDVMGWELKNEGFHVIFSKDIPTIIKKWLKPNMDEFLLKNKWAANDIQHFIAHPGGKKVLSAYSESLQMEKSLTETSRLILQQYGNMSSPTVLFVLKEFVEKNTSYQHGDKGIMLALGPGFSSELALVEWE